MARGDSKHGTPKLRRARLTTASWQQAAGSRQQAAGSMPVAAGSRQQARHVQQQSRFASTHTRECHGQSTGGLRSLGSGGVTRWARTLFLRWINKLSAPRPVWGGINTLTGWGGAAADEVGGCRLTQNQIVIALNPRRDRMPREHGKRCHQQCQSGPSRRRQMTL